MFRDVPGYSGMFHVPGFIDGRKTARCQMFFAFCVYFLTLSSELDQPELVETRNSMPRSFYPYLLEKLFLHEKSCIRRHLGLLMRAKLGRVQNARG